MNYHSTKRKVKVGDAVRFEGKEAKIVFVVDDDMFCSDYPKKYWAYLTKGVGIEMQKGKWKGALFVIYSPEQAEDLEPIQ